MELPVDLRSKCNQTLKLHMGTSCRKDYRHRLKRFLPFWKAEPLYYAIGSKPVSSEDLEGETKDFVCGTGCSKDGFTEDLVYNRLNVDYDLNFLASTKIRADGKVKSYQDSRKYKDAILWGAQVAGERLPVQFHEKMDSFLQAYKKEVQQAKKKGMVEETAADPITETLL